ncbi:hypothetical protein KM188_13350 [Mycetohabitans sp. B4]|nr:MULTISPECIES: hypothetical protein [Burkholderiaceae]MCF2135121.1 hypothetical protein [Mycetohabitans sp. B3]MCG1019642.1 hypothetical protein [Mycetohabitans sp. B4]
MSQLTERLQASLRQRLRLACAEHADTLPCGYDPALRADLIIRYVLGRWHHYARSGFHKSRLSTPLHSCGCCCNSGHTCAAYVSGTISFILVGHKLSSARRFADSIAGARTQAVQYKSG